MASNLPSLWIAYQSTSSNQLAVASCPTNANLGPSAWDQAKIPGQAKASGSTSITVYNDALYIAYREPGSDQFLYLDRSPDGVNFDNCGIYLGMSSPYGPAIGAFNDKLWIAYQSTSGNALRVASCATDPNNGPNSWVHASIPSGALISGPPSITVLNGALYIAYRAPGSDQYLNLIRSFDGVNFDNYGIYLGLSSPSGPAIGAFDNKLWVAYQSTSGNALKVASCATDPNNGPNSWVQASIPSGALISGPPSIAVFDGSLYVGYRDAGSDQFLYLIQSPDGVNFSDDNIYLGLSSPNGPGIYGEFVTSGSIYPQYKVASVIYAPPGSSAGSTQSQVVYSDGSTLGSSVSISNNTTSSTNVSASAGDDGNSAEATFGFTVSSSNSSNISMTKSTDKTITVTGSETVDGIDHSYDIFVIWVNPAISATAGSINNLVWSMANTSSTQVLLYLYAGSIYPKVNTTDLTVQTLMNDYGLTTEDFTNILQTNPFFATAGAVNLSRFRPCNQELPYEPPFSAGDQPIVTSYTLETDSSKDYSSSESITLDVGCTVSAGFDVAGMSADVSESQNFSWNSSTTNTSSSTTDQSAEAVIGGPSYGYTGPETIYLYIDVIYNTFMFSYTVLS